MNRVDSNLAKLVFMQPVETVFSYFRISIGAFNDFNLLGYKKGPLDYAKNGVLDAESSR